MLVTVLCLISAFLILLSTGYLILKSVAKESRAELNVDATKYKLEMEAMMREHRKIIRYDFQKKNAVNLCHNLACQAHGITGHRCHDLDCPDHNSV